MHEIAPRLHATEPFDLGFGRTPLQARAYVLQRDAGNVALYGAAALEPELDAVRELGGVTAQYVNHAHEVSPAAARVRDALGAPLHIHARDADEARATVSVDATFDERHLLDGDLEVIPTPGHTPGATSYLWTTPEHRVLFTGDTVFVRDGRWVAAFLDAVSDRPTYLDSLKLLAGLEFDLLVPGVAPVGEPPVVATGPDDARRRLGGIAERLRAGEDQ
jgi:glyoxylase-like metal-dependent hydrolase (beta-lactamase superfamily II)